jgi:repressor LexA
MAQKKFNKLSERQRNILRFMQKYIVQTGYPPTIREIGEATNINSTSVVNYNLNKLVEAGYLERSDRVSRGLRLVGDVPGVKGKRVNTQQNFARVPLIGQIVASKPVEIPDDSGHYYDDDDLIDVPPSLLGGTDPDQVFALKIKGESMMDAMIREGDIVIMKRQNIAQQGDMVAVWLADKGETTLKYYFPEGAKVRLQPAHPHMEPIMVDAGQCQIRGKVLSVIRQL